MEVNKDEADHCIEIAEKYIKEKNREKAEKFLHKAERLYPTQKAKGSFLSVYTHWIIFLKAYAFQICWLK